MSKHHKHGKPGKRTTQQNQIHEVPRAESDRYSRSEMTDYCLGWSIYLSEIGNAAESEIALLWASWIETATAREFNTVCDTWYTWELSQPQQLDLFAA